MTEWNLLVLRTYEAVVLGALAKRAELALYRLLAEATK